MGMDITGLGSLFDLTGKVLDKIFPDKDAADKARLEMLKLQQQGEFKQLDQDFQLALEQVRRMRSKHQAVPCLSAADAPPPCGSVSRG